MKELTLKEIQEDVFQILLTFDQFCKNNDLTYRLAGGTLLGAIRHKGFIPWDDDIDIIMLRSEYEKFVKVKDSLKREHTFISIETNPLYSASLAKIYNNKTVLIYAILAYISIFLFLIMFRKII